MPPFSRTVAEAIMRRDAERNDFMERMAAEAAYRAKPDATFEEKVALGRQGICWSCGYANLDMGMDWGPCRDCLAEGVK